MTDMQQRGSGATTLIAERRNRSATAPDRYVGHPHMWSVRSRAAIRGGAERLSYIWLGVALLLLPFGTARWSIPLAAWLYPVFLLRFVRTQPARRGIVLTIVAPMAALAIAWQGFYGPYSRPRWSF